MNLDVVLRVIEEIREDFQREEDQAILQQRLDKAIAALAGKDACDRIRRRLETTAGVVPQMLRGGLRAR